MLHFFSLYIALDSLPAFRIWDRKGEVCELPLHCVGESFCVHHALAALAACHTGAEGLLVTPFRWSQHINLSNTPCSVCLLMQGAGGSQCRLTVAHHHHHHHPIGFYMLVCVVPCVCDLRAIYRQSRSSYRAS